VPEVTAYVFTRAMFFCHLSSCTSQCFYFFRVLSEPTCIAFEVGLLVFKTLAELVAEPPFTVDLAIHHAVMFAAAGAVTFYFPEHAFMVVHVQFIHFALAIKYARQIAGHDPRKTVLGNRLDLCYVLMFLFVVSARTAMSIRADVEVYLVGAWVTCAVMWPLTAVLGWLDSLWVRELLEHRSGPSMPPLIAMAITFALGLGTGSMTTATRDSVYAATMWQLACATAMGAVFVAGLGAVLPYKRGSSKQTHLQ